MKNLFLIIFFLTTIIVKAQQDRNLIWVHGLGGDANSWAHYAAVFDAERKVNGYKVDYDTDLGVSRAGRNVAADIYRLSGDKSRNIAIGHSMGGVVSRYIASSYTATNKRFGGVITVNSPNYGAPLINAIDDGSAISAGQDALEKLSAGPLAMGLNPLPIGTDFNSDRIWQLLLTDELFDAVVKGQTRIDLKPGNRLLGEINKSGSAANSIPTINIWSEENSPVHWRFIDNFLGIGSSNTDTELPQLMNVSRDSYNGHYNAYRANAISNILNPGAYAYFMTMANKFKKGRDWIDGSQSLWCSIIETSRREKQIYYVNVWVPCDYPPRKNMDPDCGHWEYQQQTRYVNVNYPSDGVLPKYTQILTNIPLDNVYHITTANHTQVRDMSHCSIDWTKQRFDEIFNRHSNDFFHTSRK